MAREVIKNFYGQIIGSLEDTGNKIIAKDFYGKILGHYDKQYNVTKDFYGRIIAKGNIASSLIWQNYNENKIN